MPFFFVLPIIVLLITPCAQAKSTTSIQILSHLTRSPFKHASGGLVEDLVLALNNSISEAHFSIRWINKERLKRALLTKKKIIVPFIHPTWFKTKNLKHAIWSDTIAKGTNYIVSSINDPIELEDIQAIRKGQKPISFVGVKNYKYMEFQKYILNKKVIKNSCSDLENCIRLVIRGRAQTTVVPNVEYIQLLKNSEFKGKIYRSKNFVNSYERKVLLLSLSPMMQKKVKSVIKRFALKNNGRHKALR